MYNQPYYDNDTVTLGYLKEVLGDNWTEIANAISKTSKNYGTTPTTPYHKYDTFMTDDGIYICINDREIGEFDIDDWTLAGTYRNTQEDFEQGNGIITKGTLQATQGGTNTAGLTGKNSGENAIRIWAGSTLSGIDTAPFRVTQGGALVATNATITGNITATSGSISGSLVSSGINAGNITAGTLNADRISGGSISASSITGSSSINISRSSGSYFLNMGLSTSHPNVSGLNVGWGGLNLGAKGIGFEGSTDFTFSNGNLTYVDGVYKNSNGNLILKNNYTGSNIYIGNYIDMTASGSDGYGRYGLIYAGRVRLFSDGDGRQCIESSTSGNSRLTLGNAVYITSGSSGSNNVYANGNGLGNSPVLTSAGTSSSKNVKMNLKKFKQEKYDKALDLLNKIDIYDYDYKYSLYKDKHQYGFIIDYIEKIDNNEFFKFSTEKAEINKDKLNCIDENDIEKDDKKKYIEFKKYDPNVLDKFMLTTIKALQMKIDNLEKEIKMLKEDK